MSSVQEYKSFIWNKIKSKQWSLKQILSMDKTQEHNWNIALKDAQKWAYEKLNSDNEPLRQSLSKNTEILEAINNIDERKKHIKKSQKKIKPSPNPNLEEDYKRYIDEGIAGTREENKMMRSKQSRTNRSTNKKA